MSKVNVYLNFEKKYYAIFNRNINKVKQVKTLCRSVNTYKRFVKIKIGLNQTQH